MLFIYLYHTFSVLEYFCQLPYFLRQYCQQQIEALQLLSDFYSVITFNKGVVATTHFLCFLFIYSTYSYLASTHPHHSFEIVMLIFQLCFLSSLSTWSFDGISNVFTIFQNSIPLALAIALLLHTLWLVLDRLLSTSAFSTWLLNVEIPQNLFLIFTFLSCSILFRSYPCKCLMTVSRTMLSLVFSCSGMSDYVTPWTAGCQASLSFTISQSLLKLTSIESVMPSNHLILCHPILTLPSIFPSIMVFSRELALCISSKYFGQELKFQHQSFQWICRVGFF